jgi:hypothetical protein
LQVDAIQDHYLHQAARPFLIQRQKVTTKALAAHYGGLLPAKNVADCYHAFLSYRHGGRDSEMAADFYNSMSDFALGQSGEHVMVFWDVKSLENGQQFDTNFMMALSTSLVVSPLITPHALERMAQPRSQNGLDHVLLEWWLALTLYRIPGFPVLRIVPVFSGTVSVLYCLAAAYSVLPPLVSSHVTPYLLPI